jgi:two-component system, NarL family, nitrate/nitrite response regulator NarL
MASSSLETNNFQANELEPGDAGKAQTRVAIVSPVRLVRDSLLAMMHECKFLSELRATALDPAGEAEIQKMRPEIIVVDLAGARPAAIAMRLRALSPQSRLICLALAEGDEEIVACASAGFVAYVPREGDAAELFRTIDDALHGRVRIAAALFRQIGNSRNDQPEANAALTRRENEVLSLAQRGCSNKAIAQEMSISPATVKNHMHNILCKLQVNGRREAATKLALRDPTAAT